MSKCKFCDICTPDKCPKNGENSKMGLKRLPITEETKNKLDSICKEKDFLQGHSYYRVSNYEQLMKYFIDKEK